MDSLRTLLAPLKPITQNLPTPISNLGISILGPECYRTLIHDLDPTSTQCLSLAISKALGIAIISASTVVKIPQILKLLRSKSGEGISFLSYLLETTSYLIGLAYNWRSGFPFSTYGETSFIMLQNVVISVLVLQFGGRTAAAGVFVAGLAVAAAALFGEGIVDMKLLSLFQAAAGGLSVASKVPQIMTNARKGSTGQLSAVAVFNYLFGSATRIFTTLQEVDDKLILYGFVAGFVLNAVLAAQMVYYWNAPSAKVKGKQREKMGLSSGATSSGAAVGQGATTRRRA